MRLSQHCSALDSGNLYRLTVLSVPAMLPKLSHQVRVAVLFSHQGIVLYVSVAIAAVVQTLIHEVPDARAPFA